MIKKTYLEDRKQNGNSSPRDPEKKGKNQPSWSEKHLSQVRDGFCDPNLGQRRKQ